MTQNSNPNLPIEFWFTKGYVGTSEELEVAEKLGFKGAELERLKKEDGHMTEDEFYVIVPVHRILGEMEKRYHIGFEPVKLTRDGDEFALEVVAVDGPAQGQAFTAAVRGEDGSCVYRDDYYGVARKDEYNEFVNGEISRLLYECGIDAPFSADASLARQTVEQTVALFDPFHGGAVDYEGTCSVALLGPSEEHEYLVEPLIDRMADVFKALGTGIELEVDVYPKQLPISAGSRGAKLLEGAKNSIKGNKPATFKRSVQANPAVRMGLEVPVISDKLLEGVA